MPLNGFQKAVLANYAEGDYAYIAEEPYASRWRECVAVANSGDSLFQFIMIDLADEGEFKMTRAVAVQRMECAKAQFDGILWHIDKEGLES